MAAGRTGIKQLEFIEMEKIHHLKIPLTVEDIKKLKLNDIVYLSGTVFTARDKAHERAINEGKLPIDSGNSVLFHAGPIVKKERGKYRIIAIGPTTSSRMNSTEPEFIRKFNIHAIIGKGGMDDNVVNAMKNNAVYLSMTGGCAAIGAKFVKKVKDVRWLDLGIPEAVWILEVENLGPLIVSIDSGGNSLYGNIEKEVNINMRRLLENEK